jgi:hypothetical protein
MNILFFEEARLVITRLWQALLETRCLNNTTNIAEYTGFGQLSLLPDVVTTLVQM